MTYRLPDPTAATAESPSPTVSQHLLPRAWHVGLWALVVAVLAAGLFLPDLLYGDAPQYAVMALRMFRDHDWVNLTTTGRGDFLDKPHLLFWSAMSAYHLFGVHDWSYRLPSVAASLLGAYSVGRLGRRLYGPRAGQMAALIFITSQAILLGDHDVRTDALMTGFAAFGVWQLARWVETEDLRSLLAGAAGTGLSVASKGMVSAAVVMLCLLLFALGRRRLRLLVSPRVLLGLGMFFLVLGPVLACLYTQFDLHPERTIVGGGGGPATGVSGVRFLLFSQSLERFSGGRGQVGAHDPFFFFHSLLWAFLPWSLLLYAAWGRRGLELIRQGRSAFHRDEQLAFLGPLIFIVLLSFSRFKLPHYLNVFFPLLAVLVAGWLDDLARQGRARTLLRLEWIQRVVIGVLLLLTVLLSGWSFPIRSPWILAGASLLLVALAFSLRLSDALQRVWVPSAVAILLVNFLLNASFYPQLSRYQPGSDFVHRVAAEGVDFDRTWFVDVLYQPFQFYSGRVIEFAKLPQIRAEVEAGRRVFLLVGEKGKEQLATAGLPVRELDSSPDCHVTKIDRQLFSPSKRETACPRAHLLVVGG